MTAEQFCIWLQGYADLAKSAPDPEQWKVICESLDRVFVNVSIRYSVKRADEMWDAPTCLSC